MIGLGFSEGLGFPEGFGGDSEGSGNDSEGFDDDSGGSGDRRSEGEELDGLRALSTDSMGLWRFPRFAFGRSDEETFPPPRPFFAIGKKRELCFEKAPQSWN